MKTRWFTFGLLAGMLTSTGTVFAQDPPPAATSEATAPVKEKPVATTEPTLTEKLKMARLSPAVREVVKMSDAGMDVAVIQTFVENSSSAYNLTSEDVIFLHEQGIPSNIITSMLQRGAKVREQLAATAPPPPPVPAPAPVQQSQPAPGYVAQAPAPTIVETPTYVASSPNVIYIPYGGSSYYYPRHYYSRPYFNFHYSTGWSSPHFYGHLGYRFCP